MINFTDIEKNVPILGGICQISGGFVDSDFAEVRIWVIRSKMMKEKNIYIE